jgi:alpha-beta hydrolase superfamily lysophospholipase
MSAAATFCRVAGITAVVLCLLTPADAASAQETQQISVRGHRQVVHLYGSRGHTPVVVSSGDGGWIHLAPHVAEVLAAKGFFVVGIDAKAYLESFTSGKTTLRPDDEPGDYRTFADFAARGTDRKPVLIGVSEGAGLSVLAATDPQTRSSIAGVLGLGLPDITELGWRWKDSLIYLTHGVPKEPTFSTAAVVAQVSPMPLAAIHSTQDEFVALAEVEKVIAAAKAPKKLWIVNAADHGFTDNLPEFDRRLLEALGWIAQNAPR